MYKNNFSKLCASKNQDFPDQSIIFHKLKAVKGYPRLGDVCTDIRMLKKAQLGCYHQMQSVVQYSPLQVHSHKRLPI